MRALVIYCHPAGDSFTAAVRDTVLDRLRAAGAEARVTDLYAEGFQPVLQPQEWQGYLSCPDNRRLVDRHCADIDKNLRQPDELVEAQSIGSHAA